MDAGLPPSADCPDCGEIVYEDEEKCPNCGLLVHEREGHVRLPPSRKWRRLNMAGIALVAAGIVLIVFFGYYDIIVKGEEMEVSDRQLVGVYAGIAVFVAGMVMALAGPAWRSGRRR